MPGTRTEYFVSPNHLEGSLCDVPLGQILAACRRDLVTGTIKVRFSGMQGLLELRAGVVDWAVFADAIGDDAVVRMSKLRDGHYELTQRLPNLNGMLDHAAQCRGTLEDTPLVAVMRHCEQEALSVTVTIIHDFERGEIDYRAGEIIDVRLNGRSNPDAIVRMCKWERGRFRIAAPPLSLNIAGWPRVSREPTAPFTIDHLAEHVGGARPRKRVARGTPAHGLPGVPELEDLEASYYAELTIGQPLQWDWEFDSHVLRSPRYESNAEPIDIPIGDDDVVAAAPAFDAVSAVYTIEADEPAWGDPPPPSGIYRQPVPGHDPGVATTVMPRAMSQSLVRITAVADEERALEPLARPLPPLPPLPVVANPLAPDVEPPEQPERIAAGSSASILLPSTSGEAAGFVLIASALLLCVGLIGLFLLLMFHKF